MGDVCLERSDKELIFKSHTNKITPKLLSSSIDKDMNKHFLTIFNRYCDGKKPVTNVKFEFTGDKKPDHEFECVIEKAFQFLDLHGFHVDKKDGMVELWKYTSNGSKVSGPLVMHVDDRGGLEYRVETCIFYLEIDDTLDGGGLYYIENIKEHTFLGFIRYYETQTKYLEVKNCMVVLLNGNLEHRPKSILGIGTRKCIVVQFKSLGRNIDDS